MSYVYAIGNDHLVKIGWSNNPARRLIKINSDASVSVRLLGSVKATRAQEAEIQRLLSRWRAHGEWFHLRGAVVDFVTMLSRPRPTLVASSDDPAPSIAGNLNSVDDVIDELGGTGATARLLDRDPRVVSNWRARRRFPGGTYLVLTRELAKRSCAAPACLWGMESAAG